LYALKNIDINNWNTPEIPDPEPPTKDELKCLIEAANGRRNRLMIVFAAETGTRNESLRSVQIGHIDFEQSLVEIKDTKHGGAYPIPLSDELALRLKRWVKVERERYMHSSDHDYLFPSRTGEKIPV
jgi:integrase